MMPLASDSPPVVPREPPLSGALRVAALGGGTGLPNVLRGLRSLVYPAGSADGSLASDRLVAIVTTTDDGGSSGRLRRDFNVIPPGDVRNCLAALADSESDLAALLQFRFQRGDGLSGHALGNLMLAALTEVTGDFTKAVEIAGQVVGARGRVLPATTDAVTLTAELHDGRRVAGETAIVSAGTAIRRIRLDPAEPRCADTAIDALRRADVIVGGPGSLYTSILPPLLVPELIEAIRLADAVRVFVLNLMTEPGETDGFSAAQHLAVVADHVGFQPFDRVVFNTTPVPDRLATDYARRGSEPVRVTASDLDELRDRGVEPFGAPLLCEGPEGRIRHHPGRLAAAIAACAALADPSVAAPRRGMR
jgi:uncharacterized cofD-like protein